MKRRSSDDCPAKKLWDWGTPYIQILGFVATIIAVTFAGGGKWDEVNAAIGDVATLKIWQAQVNTQQAVMKQELDDLHAWYAKDTGRPAGAHR